MVGLVSALAIALSTHVAHARDVRATLTFHYDMQCGYPGSAPLAVTVPQHVPATLSRSSVLLDGKPVPGLRVHGHTVTLQMPPRPIVMCMSIGPGTLKIEFTRGARLANPIAGRYRVGAVKGTLRFSAPLLIR